MHPSWLFRWRTLSRVVGFAPLVAMCALSAQTAPPRARIIEDLRLDAEKEDFPAISRIFVGPQHQIAVPIQGDMQIRLYDQQGKRIGAFGRKGSGPGEFRWVGSLMWKADTLVVDDGEQRRLSYVTPDARVIRTVVYPDLRSVQLPNQSMATTGMSRNYSVLGVSSDGTLLIQWNAPVANPTPMQRAFGGTPYILRLKSDGTAKLVLRNPDWADERWAMEAFGFGDGIPFTYGPTSVASSTGDRVAHLTSMPTSRDSGSFTVSAFRANGDTMFVRTFPYRGVPIPGSVRDSAIAAIAKMPEGGKAVIDRFQDIARKKTPFTYPGVDYMLLGLDNTVWVALRATAQGQPVMVLNRKGEPIATVLVPKNSRLRQASATQVWMTEKDADGLASVVRYKVSGISCGAIGC